MKAGANGERFPASPADRAREGEGETVGLQTGVLLKNNEKGKRLALAAVEGPASPVTGGTVSVVY